MLRFANKVALITGAASGIGRATARLFADEGASVGLIDQNRAGGDETCREIQQAGGRARFFAVDVSQAEQLRAAIEATAEQFDGLDILSCNAAIQISRRFDLLTEEEWDRQQAVNLKAMFLCCKFVVPHMRRRGTGAIMLTASPHALVTYPTCSGYAASKGGVTAFVRGAALDCAPDNIRVNCVLPGATDTPLLREYIEGTPDPEATRDGIIDRIALKRLATPEDIAHVTLFLASEQAAFITGTYVLADGGQLARG
jgi:meso-butanediol dehydrogenase/(S,S)-butanediol dehydrogenase/diacetyl reductase